MASTEHAPGRAPFAALFVQGRPKDGEPFLVSLRELTASLSSDTGTNQK